MNSSKDTDSEIVHSLLLAAMSPTGTPLHPVFLLAAELIGHKQTQYTYIYFFFFRLVFKLNSVGSGNLAN